MTWFKNGVSIERSYYTCSDPIIYPFISLDSDMEVIIWSIIIIFIIAILLWEGFIGNDGLHPLRPRRTTPIPDDQCLRFAA